MNQYYFRIPYAATGDKANIPETPQVDGSVSMPTGWGEDYQKNLKTDANAKAVERGVMNNILNLLSNAVRALQSASFPEFITAEQNGGTALPYGRGLVVRYPSATGFDHYVSLIDNNTFTPGTNANAWQPFAYRVATQDEVDSGQGDFLIVTPPTLQKAIDNNISKVIDSLAPKLFPIGGMIHWGGTVPPSGWIEANGQQFDLSENPELAKVYPSGRVPDMRGKFVRGWAHGSTSDPDPSRDVLSEQAAADLEHYHYTGRLWGDASYNDDFWFIDRGNDVVRSGEYPAFVVTGDSGASRRGTYPSTGGGQFGATTDTRAGAGAERIGEPYPANVAWMYIIKSDKAENIAPEPTPNNLVVTPSSAVVQVGNTLTLAGRVLPANLASQYPITWISTDTSVGTVDDAGRYVAVSRGEVEVLASISTGLTTRVRITNYVALTSISLAAIPDQVSGTSYQLSVVLTPGTATEPLTYTSSNNAVAGVGADGLLQSTGQGTASITVSGAYSNVRASRNVVVTNAPVVEKYLQIDNYLSEFRTDNDKLSARRNLGLGTLATRDRISTDLVDPIGLSNQNLDSIAGWGFYFQSNPQLATAANNYPVSGTTGVLQVEVVYGASSATLVQTYKPVTSSVQIWTRQFSGTPGAWSPWFNVSGGSGNKVAKVVGTTALVCDPAQGLFRTYLASPFGNNLIDARCFFIAAGYPFSLGDFEPGWGYDPAGGSVGMQAAVNYKYLEAGAAIFVTVGSRAIAGNPQITGGGNSRWEDRPADRVTSIGANLWYVLVTDLGPRP